MLGNRVWVGHFCRSSATDSCMDQRWCQRHGEKRKGNPMVDGLVFGGVWRLVGIVRSGMSVGDGILCDAMISQSLWKTSSDSLPWCAVPVMATG